MSFMYKNGIKQTLCYSFCSSFQIKKNIKFVLGWKLHYNLLYKQDVWTFFQ